MAANPRLLGYLAPYCRPRPPAVAGFVPFATADGCGVVAAALAATGDFSLTDFLAPAAAPDAITCKKGRHIRAVISGGYFYKAYRHAGGARNFRYLFRAARPFTVLGAAEHLRRLAIPTPPVILAFRADRRWAYSADYAVTAVLPPDTLFADRLPLDAIAALGTEICPMLAQMHQSGLAHGDLSLRNLYRAPAGATYPWGCIDLDGARIFPRPLSAARREREIARIASSAGKILGYAALSPAMDNLAGVFLAHYAAAAGGTALNPAAVRRHCARLLAHRPH